MKKSFGSQPYFYPCPVLIIATYDENKNPDAMNAAWGGLYDRDQVVLCLSQNHKTTENIKAQKAFTISFADTDHIQGCDYVGLVSGHEESNKIQKAGFHVVKSELVNAPVIEELPVTLECEFVRCTEEGNIIGKILNVLMDEDVLDDKGQLDMNRFHPISFEPFHRTYHVLGEKVGQAFSDGAKLK